jgi:hypothetical protein
MPHVGLRMPTVPGLPAAEGPVVRNHDGHPAQLAGRGKEALAGGYFYLERIAEENA